MVVHPDFQKYFILDIPGGSSVPVWGEASTINSIQNKDCFIYEYIGPVIKGMPLYSKVFLSNGSTPGEIGDNYYSYIVGMINEIRESGHFFALIDESSTSSALSLSFLHAGDFIANITINDVMYALCKIVGTDIILKKLYFSAMEYLTYFAPSGDITQSPILIGMEQVSLGNAFVPTPLHITPDVLISKEFTERLLTLTKDDYILFKVSADTYLYIHKYVPYFLINVKNVDGEEELSQFTQINEMPNTVALMTITHLLKKDQLTDNEGKLVYGGIFKSLLEEHPNLYLVIDNMRALSGLPSKIEFSPFKSLAVRSVNDKLYFHAPIKDYVNDQRNYTGTSKAIY